MEEMEKETPEPNYEKLMLWSFITIFALLGFFTVYNHYFPEENRSPRPTPTQPTQSDEQDVRGDPGAEPGQTEQPAKSNQ